MFRKRFPVFHGTYEIETLEHYTNNPDRNDINYIRDG